jgi:imidazole glycerol phosphate synthase subunit HisF
VNWAAEAQQRGAGEILLTSFDRDGTRSGYDLELMRAVTAACSLPVIASGGANSVAHMVEAFNNGAHAVLAASIFHDGNMTVEDVKRELTSSGVEVRV